MLNRYNITLGFYEPAIFHIHTRGTGRLKNFNQWDVQQKSTFLHEYVHYLQDITTIQGLNNYYILGEYMRYVTKIIKSSSNIISLPINRFTANHNVGQNWIAYSCVMGDKKPVKNVLSYYPKYVTDLIDENNGEKIPLNVVILKCEGYNIPYQEIIFGTIHIMEGMANLIQNLVYPHLQDASPYNPYHIAVDVVDMIIPGFSSNKLTLISLLDFALQHSNPGLALVGYLEKKRSEGYNATSLTSDIIYNDLMQEKVCFSSLSPLSFKDAYIALADAAKDVMKDYLGNVWYWRNMDKWFQTIINRGIGLRLNAPELFQQLAIGGDITSNDVFLKIFKEFGSPIVTNSPYNFDFISPKNVFITKEEMINIYAMMQFPRVFSSNGTFSCPLRKYCQNKPCGFHKQKVDKRCLTQPWTRMRKWNRCYFNTWWYFKGFKNLIIR